MAGKYRDYMKTMHICNRTEIYLAYKVGDSIFYSRGMTSKRLV